MQHLYNMWERKQRTTPDLSLTALTQPRSQQSGWEGWRQGAKGYRTPSMEVGGNPGLHGLKNQPWENEKYPHDLSNWLHSLGIGCKRTTSTFSETLKRFFFNFSWLPESIGRGHQVKWRKGANHQGAHYAAITSGLCELEARTAFLKRNIRINKCFVSSWLSNFLCQAPCVFASNMHHLAAKFS